MSAGEERRGTVALGSGRTLFEGIRKRLALRRTTERSFGNGNVLLCYEPRDDGPGSARAEE